MKRECWFVTEDSVRPARPDNTCFYCNEPVGMQHKESCPVRTRTIVVKTTIEHIVVIPESFTDANIAFLFNEGSSCGSNIISKIKAMSDRLDDVSKCMCSKVSTAFVREATIKDEESCETFIKNEES